MDDDKEKAREEWYRLHEEIEKLKQKRKKERKMTDEKETFEKEQVKLRDLQRRDLERFVRANNEALFGAGPTVSDHEAYHQALTGLASNNFGGLSKAPTPVGLRDRVLELENRVEKEREVFNEVVQALFTRIEHLEREVIG